MAEYGHGNHWASVTNREDWVKDYLPEMLTNGKLEDESLVHGVFFENEFPTDEKVFAIRADSDMLSGLSLIAANEAVKQNLLVTFYPFVREGTVHRMKLTDILEWPEQIEAILTASAENDFPISFFDTKYFKNKSNYEIGEEYDFSISAIAYSAEIPERSFSFEGQDAINFLQRTGREPQFNAQGKVDPVVFDTSKLVALLPIDKNYPHEYEFQSPIHSIHETKFVGEAFYEFSIFVHREPDIPITLISKKVFFNTIPKVNDPLRGTMWMQGYLAEKQTR